MTSPLRTMIRDLHRRRGRERRGLALAEGVRLVEEALAAELPLRGAAISPALEATTRGRALKSALERRAVRIEPVSESELATLADTEHPQGVVAVVEPRRWTMADIDVAPGRPVLALDGCALACVKHSLAERGVEPDRHLLLNEQGVKKRYRSDFDADEAERLLAHARSIVREMRGRDS